MTNAVGGPELSSDGRYRVVERLGQGAAGEVFLVEDSAERPVHKALKLLRANLPRALVDGFRAEFRILASLEHPALARVYEFGALPEGRFYYTSEYVAGRELGQLPQHAWRDVCRALATVCRALAYVHARGYVHNDVKPSNVIVGDDVLDTTLLDFGLAGLERERTRFVYGTPGYIAPERLLGLRWDYRADLYSVGATAYRVLSGRRPTDEAEPAAALAELRERVPSLGLLRPDLPVPLVALVESLLAFDPESRPRHAFDVVAAFGGALGEVLPLETAGAARCYALASMFVGRDDVLADVERGLGAAFAGAIRRCFVIAAGPGLGKTRLLSELVQRHETDGGRAAWVRVDGRDDGVGPLARAAAALGVVASDADDADAIWAAFESAATRSKKGLLLVLDDAERLSDRAFSWAFSFAERARRVGLPLAIVAAVSPNDLPTPARQRIALGVAAGEASRIDLGPLTRVHVDAMLASLFGDGVIPSAVREDLVHRSAGNPLLLEEMVREIVDEGRVRSTREGWKFGEPTSPGSHPSERLEDFLRRRSRGLVEPARETFAGLAALGGSADAKAIRAVVGDVDVELGLALLAEHSLVRFASGRAVAAHEPALGVALELVSAERGRDLHRAAAEWLAANGADDQSVGRAWLEAGELRNAWDHLVRYGARALRRGEGRAALGALESALGLADRAAVGHRERASATLDYAKSASLAGRANLAIEMALAAYALFPEDAHLERVEAAFEATFGANRAGRAAEMAAYVELAHAASRPEEPLEAALSAHAASYKAHFADGALAEGERHAERATRALALAPPGPETIDLRVRIEQLRGMRALVTDFAIAVAVHREILPYAERLEDRAVLIRILNNYGYALLQQRRLGEAHAVLTRALSELEPLGSLSLMPFVLNNLSEVCQSQGDSRAADEHVRRASLIARETEHPLPFASVARVAWREGDADALARAVEPHLSDPRARLLHAESLMRVLVVAAAAAANRADIAAGEQQVALAEELRQRRTWPVFERYAKLVAAYANAAKAAGQGAARLLEAADGLEEVGALSDALVVRRDAGRFFAKAGDTAAARVAYESVREAHLEVGSGAGVIAIDRLLSELDASNAPARIQEALPLRGKALETVLESALVEAGFRVKLRWQDQRDTAPRVSVIAERGNEQLVIDGPTSVPDHVTTLLRAIARQLLAEPPPAERTIASRVESDRERSRAFELTVGPVELSRSHPGIVGESSAVMRALALLDRLAKTDAPVLISGETGTGKEVFARALHRASARTNEPFVVVNCAAIPAQLFEAELFGYRRGAFTGATRNHAGIVREAHGGMLFLDEIGELPLDLQPKLLRVLQERTVRGIGDDQDHEVDVRILAATNRNLELEVAAHRFRADLYWRLNVVEVSVPPLRDRAGDIEPLARHFLANLGRSDQTLTRKAERLLTAYTWPGNVRELENVIQRASILADPGVIEPKHLPERLLRSQAPARGETLAEKRNANERQAISAMLRETGGNLTRAAERLGLTRQGLQFKLKQLGLTREGHSPRKRKE